MAAQKGVTQLGNLILGTCLPCLRHNASKFKVKQLEFDTKLLMYFPTHITLFAYDPDKICKTGDIVLIKELDKPMSTKISHKVLQVVYPMGDVTDPVTGKKVIGKYYRDELDTINSLYGPSNSTYDYDKAPPRGWQKGKRDFSHRELYLKYNEFEKGDENEHQPYAKQH